MTPPVLAQALVAATAPPNDYESVAGDLHEEYVRLTHCAGEAAANRWYWSQALRSIPSLLSYSRLHRSIATGLVTASVALAVLVAMLLAVEPIQHLLLAAFGGSRSPMWALFSAEWLNAALFGAILASAVRSGGIRLALWSSLFFIAAIVVPTFLGYSSRLPLYEWLLIVGLIPSMSTGAGLYQIIRRHRKD